MKKAEKENVRLIIDIYNAIHKASPQVIDGIAERLNLETATENVLAIIKSKDKSK